MRHDADARPAAWGWVGANLDAALRRVQSRRAAHPLGMPGTAGDLYRPLRGWTSKFTSAREVASVAAIRESAFGVEVWRPLRVVDQLSLLVYADRRHVASVVLLRSAPRRPFGRSVRNRLRPVVTRLGDRLRHETAREISALPIEEGAVVLFVDGSKLQRCPNGARWLALPEVREAAEALLCASSPPTGCRTEAGVRLGWRAMEGETGPATLLTLRRATRLELAADADLSPLQREVAALAARRMSLLDLAARLDRAPETVKAHLKAIYERLGVHNRSELARVLAASPVRWRERGDRDEGYTH